MADAGLRKIEILLKLLQSKHKITTRELESSLSQIGYSAAIRTIQRDINELSTILPLTEVPGNGPGKEGLGYAIAKSHKNLIPFLDPVTALAFVMGAEHLKDLLPPSLLKRLQPFVEKANETISTVDKLGFSTWTDKIAIKPHGSIFETADVDLDIIETIYQALLQDRQILAEYNGGKPIRIHPLGLVHKGHQLFLACRFADFEDVRVTVLQRFDSVKLLDEKAITPEDFSLQEYVLEGSASWKLGPDVKVVLIMDKWWGEKLLETPLSLEQHIEPYDDTSVKVTAKVKNTREFKQWIFSLESQVEVIKPKSLRDEVIKSATKTLNIYTQRK